MAAYPTRMSTMLRVHCIQLFYNLSDPAMEDAFYDIESMRRFAGLSLFASLLDETTMLKFRRLLEKPILGKRDPQMHQAKKVMNNILE